MFNSTSIAPQGIYLSSGTQTSGSTAKIVPLNSVDSAYNSHTTISSNQISVLGGGWVRITGRAEVSTGFGYTVTSYIRINGSGTNFATGPTNTNASVVSATYYANPGDLIALWSTDSSFGAGSWDTGTTVTYLHVTPLPSPPLLAQAMGRSSLR